MTQISGSFIGPGNDAADGTVSLLNPLDSFRANLYDALGGRMGVVRGGAVTGVAGQMQVSIAAGSWVVAERDGSGNAFARAYRLDSTAATVVQFTAASASARNDALIAVAVDTEDGARGTGNLAIGWHLAVVPGVSGTATPRTDAQIATYVGRGGWERLADVPIASTDTQINMANLVNKSLFVNDWNPLSLTAGAGFAITAQRYRRLALDAIYLEVIVTRTGADINSSATCDISPDVAIISSGFPAALIPASQPATFHAIRNGISSWGAALTTAGVLNLSHSTGPSQTLPTGGSLIFIRGQYFTS